MLNASSAAQDLVASYKGGKVPLKDLQAAQNVAKESTIGLTIAQTALNMAISLGFGLLINLAVKGISKLINANQEAIDKAKELKEEYEDFKSTNSGNVKTLKDLEEEFNELSGGVSQYGDNVSLTTEQYERYKEIIQQIVEMSPSLAEGYSTENGYIVDKNLLLERAIELQEKEYRNELRRITNLENLKTSMSGYVAEYKKAFDGTASTSVSNALWKVFNTNNRKDYSDRKMAEDIIMSLGIEDINEEIEKYINKNGVFEWSSFWNDYIEIIVSNLDAVINSVSYEEVGLKEKVFDQYVEKFESLAQSYVDMKDSLQNANDEMRVDLGYIAEYTNEYSGLSTEQQKFVSEFLKTFDISDITSKNMFGVMKYDADKMAYVKSQIKNFVKNLSQDERSKEALTKIYAIPEDDQSVEEFVEQFRNALAFITRYCEANKIEIPITITDKEKEVDKLEAQRQRAINFAKENFDGYDPTTFFKDNSINTQEEIDRWLEIARSVGNAAEAEEWYLRESSKVNTSSFTDTISDVQKLSEGLDQLDKIYADVLNKEDFDWASILNNDDFKETFGNMTNIPEEYKTVYDDFIKTVSNNADDINACQESFNKLATAYIYNTAAMKNLTKETEKATIAFLEQKGIVNAEEIVRSEVAARSAAAEAFLTTKKIDATIASEDLEDATFNEIATLLSYENVAEEARNYLFRLASAKVDLNNHPINNKSDVDAIIGIANAAGRSTEYVNALKTALDKLQKMSSLKSKLESSGALGNFAAKGLDVSDYKTEVEKYIDDLKTAILNPYDFYVDYEGGESSDSERSSSDSKKTFDWIEKALTRIQEAYNRINKVVSATYKSWNNRNTAISQEIENVRNQIDLNRQAYEGYINKANSIGLSEYYKELVRNGAISISDIEDKDIQEQIEDYQTWYEKAIACSDAVRDLQDNLADLAQTRFDNIAKQYEERISVIEHETDMLDGTISIMENKGYLVSAKLYDSLIQNENKRLSELQSEYASLNNEIKGVEQGTEMWYDMYEQILSVEKEIQDSTNSIVEFNNELRQLQWDVFDDLQERISQITEEAEFFIDLMSNDKMFGDNGITEFGRATLGLHAVNYNTYMAQADEYAKELEQINDDLANDPNNQTLLERRQELLESQRDMIKSAEDEKQSIKSLMEDGYDTLLDSMQKLIDKRKELLSGQKDLYDYEKSITESTKNIASLEKQLNAYGGDNSEETQAKIQQIKVDLESAREELEETEYEKFISDQEQLYDSILDETENWINQRLDDLDGLINDVIAGANKDAELIKNTLVEQADSVGITLSKEMESIWSPNGTFTSVVTAYANGFSDKMTTVSDTLAGIKDLVAAMVKDADKKAEQQHNESTKAGAGNTSSSTSGANAGNSSGSNSAGNTNGSSNNESSNGWGSWFINKKDYYPKSKLNTDSSIVDKILSTLNTLNCGKSLRDLTTKHILLKEYVAISNGIGMVTSLSIG